MVERIRFTPAHAEGREDGATFSGDGVSAPFRLWQWEDGSQTVSEIGRGVARPPRPRSRACSPAARASAAEKWSPQTSPFSPPRNDQAQEMQTVLCERGIPSALLSSSSVFASREARELLTLLHAVSRPAEETRLRAALLTESLGLTMAEVHALTLDGRAWEEWSARFHSWHEVWCSSGFIAMCRRLVRDAGVRPRLLAKPDGERRVTNFLHLAEILQTAATADGLAPAAIVRWLGERVAAPPPRQDAHELRLERDDDAVRIVTVHKSKGLQYNIVFCPYAWKAAGELRRLRFHDDTGQAIASLCPEGEPGDLRRAQTESLAEEVRLLYVALTRARHRCDAVIGRFPKHLVSASNWLLQGPPEPSSRGDDLRAELQTHFKGIDEAAWKTNLEAVATKSRGTVAVVPVPSVEAPRLPGRRQQNEGRKGAGL